MREENITERPYQSILPNTTGSCLKKVPMKQNFVQLFFDGIAKIT